MAHTYFHFNLHCPKFHRIEICHKIIIYRLKTKNYITDVRKPNVKKIEYTVKRERKELQNKRKFNPKKYMHYSFKSF
jgi:hypothetical protein